jgi:hypothetical protein
MHEELNTYSKQVNNLIASLNKASGLSWVWETTGGGCDCLETIDDAGRLIMLTDCNAGVPLETDDDWCIGIYADADSCGMEHTHMAYANDVRSCVAALKTFQAEGVISYEHVQVGR